MTDSKIDLTKKSSLTISFRSMKNLSLFILTVLIFTCFSAQAFSQIPAPKQSTPIALTGATIHTMAGATHYNGTILFEDGIITAIGTDVTLPDGTEIKDVSGKYIYPGFIDAWSQIGIFEISAVNMTLDLNETGPINPNVMVERAFNPGSRHIGVARSAGITTVVTTPGSGFGAGLIPGQSAAMMLEGWAWDEMTLKSGVGLMVNWPNPGNQRNYNNQLEQLRQAFDDARAYKRARTAMEEGNAPHHDFDSRWNAMIPVFEKEMPIVVSANDVRQIQDAVTFAQEQDVLVIILGGRDAHLVADFLRDENVPVLISTVQSSPGRWWEPYNAWYELPAKLHEAGVRFAIAGSSSAANANRLPFEAGTAAAFGLPVDVAVKSLTVYPAQILGLDDRIGTLEAGKDASFLITDGNPIEYKTRVEQVYIQGRKSDMNDMHRQFYNMYYEKVQQRRAE